jgi:CheY-like chemotaxis protein
MSRRVLVVDDDPDILEVSRTCLEVVGGYTVESASSGGIALRILETGELPDAILLDVMMPGLDGLSLVRRLRQCDRTRDLPVVLLTAKNLSHEVHLDQLGIRGALGKPFDPMTLPAQFAQLVGWGDGSAS